MTDIDAYAQVASFRLFIRAGDEPAVPPDPDDALMELALIGASRSIDRYAGRNFRPAGMAATIRYFTADTPPGWWGPPPWNPAWQPSLGSRYRSCPVSDFMDDTGLVVELDTNGDRTYATATADYWLAPSNAADQGRPWTALIFGSTVPVPAHQEAVRVTALWGWDAIPDAISYATLLQASRMYKRRDAPFGVAGSPDIGSELRLLAKLDPDVSVLVSDYKRRWGAV